jgi:hypothetical protein
VPAAASRDGLHLAPGQLTEPGSVDAPPSPATTAGQYARECPSKAGTFDGKPANHQWIETDLNQ